MRFFMLSMAELVSYYFIIVAYRYEVILYKFRGEMDTSGWDNMYKSTTHLGLSLYFTVGLLISSILTLFYGVQVRKAFKKRRWLQIILIFALVISCAKTVFLGSRLHTITSIPKQECQKDNWERPCYFN
jgi:heme/copper-type cytochrome/quinol oxidase subunit 3